MIIEIVIEGRPLAENRRAVPTLSQPYFNHISYRETNDHLHLQTMLKNISKHKFSMRLSRPRGIEPSHVSPTTNIKLSRRLESLHRRPSLNDGCGTLYEAKHNREEQNKGGYPKGEPLDLFPIVMPQSRDCFRLRLIKRLLQDGNSISPEFEFLNVSASFVELSASLSQWIKTVFLLYFGEPFLDSFITLRKEKC